MKKIIGLLAFLIVTQAWADCSVYSPKKVICRGKAGKVSMYHLGKDDVWRSKHYYPESPGEQTEAVYFRTYKTFDLKTLCQIATVMKIQEDSLELNQDVQAAIEIDCQNKHNDFLAKIEKGVEVDIPAFELALGKAEDVSAMYCMKPTYVRTYKYNKITQLETDRQDFSNLKPGTYCQDFLTAKDIHWTPPKGSVNRSYY